MHDDDPAEGPDSPEPDPLAALVQPPARGLSGDPATEALQQRAKLAEDRLAEVLNAYRQVKTESEGYRDRISRNLERRFDQRRERLLLKFIEILDNLDRALEATEQTYTGTPMIEGIILVRTQLLSVLQEEGLERIPVLGLAYDPSVAEAVETRPVAEAEHHHVVVKELLRGYRLNGRVARAARVTIGEYQAEASLPAPVEEPLVGADEVGTDDVGTAEVSAAEVGADEVGADEGGTVEPAPQEELNALEEEAPAPDLASTPTVADDSGLDSMLDGLLEEVPADTEPEPDPPPPPPAPQAPSGPPAEIDLLKEVLDDDER